MQKRGVKDRKAAAAVRKIKREFMREADRIVESLKPRATDQHTRCDYCGRSYLITPHLAAGAGCGPCVNMVNWMPQAGKIMLDAVIYRLKALEALRQVHENDLQKLRQEVALMVRRPKPKRRAKAKRRKGGRR